MRHTVCRGTYLLLVCPLYMLTSPKKKRIRRGRTAFRGSEGVSLIDRGVECNRNSPAKDFRPAATLS